MAEQIHKKFTDEQVKDLMKRYLNKELKREHIQEVLGIGQTRFFALVKSCRQNPLEFSIQYKRHQTTRSINPAIEKNIITKLQFGKELIDNKAAPIWSYNYSFIKNELKKRYKQIVSLPTIITRAKQHGFYIQRSKKSKSHTREVITNNVGELIQHDSSLHLWAPLRPSKNGGSSRPWMILAVCFLCYPVKNDSALPHIRAVERIFLSHGLPLRFYTDSDSIFRFVRGRDELHYKHHQLTDEATPQWKHVLNDCQVKVVHALSPQAKGKIERPYRWIQDHLVRICAREQITTLAQANQVLFKEVHEYNHKRVHATTEEIPYLRYQRALRERLSALRKFMIPPPCNPLKTYFALGLTELLTLTGAYQLINYV